MLKRPVMKEPSPEERVWLETLIEREYIAAFIVLGILMGLTVLKVVPVGTAVGAPASEQVKAPWVFGGIQQLLLFWPPWLAGLVLPLCSFLIFLTFPKWIKAIGERKARGIIYALMGFWGFLTFYYALSR